MADQKKIDFQQARDFGNKINTTFAYISQNFKSLSLSIIYISAPLMLIGGIVYAMFFDWYLKFISGAMEGGEPDFSSGDVQTIIITVTGVMLVSIFAGALIVTIVYSHMMIYKENELRKIEVSEVWERVKKEFTGILGAQIGLVLVFSFSITIVAGILVGIPIAMESIFLGVIGYLVVIILLFYVIIAISLCFIIKFNERADFFTMIRRSIFLIKDKWWSTFGLIFIMNLISGAISYIFAIPSYLITFMSFFHSFAETGTFPEEMGEGLTIANIIASTIYIFGSYIVYILPLVAIAFQYFNLVELKEATGLMDKIQNIGEEEKTDDSEEHY
jgi:hypothetical protein